MNQHHSRFEARVIQERTRPRTRAAARKQSPRLEPLESRCLLSSINEFTLSSISSDPMAIIAGPAGNLWFADTGNSAIGAINPATHGISEFSSGLTPGSNPEGITYDPADGELWFTEAGNPTASPPVPSAIGMFNPSTDTVSEFTTGLTANSSPMGITVGKDGNIWFTEAGSSAGGVPSAIGMINPTTDAISEFTSGLTASSNPVGIAAGADGNLWFTEEAADKIGMINPGTDAFSEFSTGLTPGVFPIGITPGPDGNVWFTAAGNTSTSAPSLIGMINLKTDAISEFSTGFTPTSQLTGITAGPDGNLWFTEPGTSQIGAINPATQNITSISTTAGAAPYAIASGPDGNVWFTERNLPFTSSTGLPVSGGAIGVVKLDTHVVITSQPPADVSGAGGFGLTAAVEYDTGIVDSEFTGSVTVELSSNPGGATLGGQVLNTTISGVASFSGLTLSAMGSGYTLQVSASGAASATTNPFDVSTSINPLPPIPTITGVQVLTRQKTNKHGKPVGEPMRIGFAIDFNTAMSLFDGNAADYQLVAFKGFRRVRKVEVPVYKNVAFTVNYTPASTSVTLVLADHQTFPRGGLLAVMDAPSNGVTSASGFFVTGQTEFAISAGARAVTPV